MVTSQPHTHLNPGRLLKPIKGVVQLRRCHPAVSEDLRHNLQHNMQHAKRGRYSPVKSRIFVRGQTACAWVWRRSIAVCLRNVGSDRCTPHDASPTGVRPSAMRKITPTGTHMDASTQLLSSRFVERGMHGLDERCVSSYAILHLPFLFHSSHDSPS